MFTNYYNELSNTLPASDLSHYFVYNNLISLSDHDRIIRSSVPQDAAQILLDKVSLQLQDGNFTVFYKMLSIMDHHDDVVTNKLSLKIRSELDDAIGSSEQGYNKI